MAPRDKRNRGRGADADRATVEDAELASLERDARAPDNEPDEEDLPYYVELDGHLLNDDGDDHLYRNSDEVLTDNRSERAPPRYPAKAGPRFNGV